MIFSSYTFIFAFLPIVLLGYFILSKVNSNKIQKIFLVFSSLYFYGYFNWSYLLIIITSIIVNFSLANLMRVNEIKRNKTIIFVVGLLFNIGLIGYFKYYNFFVENINIVFNIGYTMRNILLPLGISFFTFQQFSFLLSVYKQEEDVETFLDYSLFVTFFPQLIAGPIVTYSEMMPQFKNLNNKCFSAKNFSRGMYTFSIGLFKKIVIADTVAVISNNGFSDISQFGFIATWTFVLSYAMQIYFDFSGYSDMAIGLGQMFNIHLPINFNSPYKSRSIKEFWNRWHMTLGRALATYIYIPLGGNRKGLIRKNFNLLLTFLVSGLWHGASWNFVIWGGFHGLFSIFERLFANSLNRISSGIRNLATFFIVVLLWVLFRSVDLVDALSVYRNLFDISNIGFDNFSLLMFDGYLGYPEIFAKVYIVGIVILLMFLCFFKDNTITMSKSFKPNFKTATMTYLCLIVSIVHLTRLSPFIYFNF